MRKSSVIVLIACGAAQVFATGMGLKPGLWESKIVKQVVDGQDRTAQITGMAAKMQQAMANMPPEQRAQMESMMKQHAGGAMSGDGGFKMCISAEEANRDKPVIDREGKCQPATVTHSGDHTTFTINCSSNGNVTTGKGESTSSGDTITTQVDMTITKANGESHVMHNETEMRYLGADCGDVKPLSVPKASP